ncbi:MAG: hypothetical protein NWR97_03410 [Salibacteraceae bacterium]|nr:hypothetical protein [Salibacteraceae bacterium]MDP4762677.1 hypothetical protein [Salibacteraceae bacterium]
MFIKRLFIIAPFALLLFSCKPDTTADFTISESADFTLPGSSVDGIFITLESNSFETGIVKLMEDNNTTPELIEKVEISGLTVALTKPTATSVSFVDNIQLFLKNGDGDTLAISYFDTLSSSEKTASTITLEVKDRNELKAWIQNERLNYVARIKINGFYADDRIFKVSSTIKATATQSE